MAVIGHFNSRLISLLSLGGVLFCFGPSAWGQFVYTESFSNESANGWTFIQEGTTPGPRLTSGLAPANVDPEFGQPQIDSAGQGWLRMATTTGDQANAAYLNIALPAAGAAVRVEFDFAFWDAIGNPDAPNPGDGVAFFLSDANTAFSAGAYGGSLGYAQKTGIDGLAGGYVGMGLDVYGNYPNPTEGRVGGPGFDPNNVTVRGPGNGTIGYDFVGTADLDTVVGGTNDNLGFATYTARPDQDALDYRHAIFTIDENGNYAVQLQFGFESAPLTVLSGTLTGPRPDEFRLGFTSGTGGATQVYELRNLEVEISGGTNSFYWDDNNGNNAWGTGANWDKNTVPTNGATVYFTDSFSDVDSPETVNLGANRTIGSAFFSGAKEYTLAGNTLILDELGTSNLSRIQIFNNPNGNAEHTISSAVQLNNNLQILHQIEKEFTISGAVNLQSFNMLVDTASLTTVSGIVSGTGSITKNGNGTLVLSGANTYSGTTTINNGILEVQNGSGLGNASGAATVNSGGTLALSNNISVTSSQDVIINGTGEGGVGALFNLSGSNTWQGDITLGSDATIGVNAGSTFTHGTNGTLAIGSNDLTLDIEGTANFNRTITGNTDSLMVKTGAGTATFSGNNTGFNGDVLIQNGTARVTGDEDALGDESTITMGNAGTAATDNLALLINNGLTFDRPIVVANQGNSTTIGGYNTGNTTTTISGTISLGKTVILTDSSTSATTGTTFSGIISGTGGIQKEGTGTVTLSGVNTFTGDVDVNAGTLKLGSATSIANTVAVNVGGSGTFNLNGNSETIGSLAGAGNVVLGGSTLTTGGNNADTTFAGVASGTGGGITKTGTGTMLFTGANTFTGTLTINGGSATDPSTVQINASNRFAAGSSLDLGNNGEFRMTNGADQTFANLTLSSTSATTPGILDFDGGDSDLTITNVGTAAGTTDLTIQNWNGSLTGNGDSEFLFNIQAEANDIAAETTFEGWGAATVVANGSIWEVVPLVTGNEWDGSNVSNNWNAGTVGFNTNWRTAGNATDNNTAAPNAAGATALFRNLDPNLNGATISLNGNRTLGNLLFASTGGQAFTIANDTLTMDASAGSANITLIGNSSPTITSNVTLADNLLISNNSTGTFTMSTGTLTGGNFDITATGAGTTVISQSITESGGGGSTDIIKNGTGTLRLSGNNTFGGTVTINNGIVEVQSTNALGTTGSSTTVNNGGTLGLSNNVTTAAEAVTINGAGYNGVGALSNISGNNTYAGAITAGSAATIGSQSGTLTLSGGVATGGNVITYHTNGGNITQSSGITGSGSVVKTGNNTLTMQSNASTFSGGLTINAGTVTTGAAFDGAITIGATVAGENRLGTGPIVVNTGGTLTTTQNVSGGTTGYDFTARGTLTNNGGTITITNGMATEYNADTILNGATINQNGGTTSFVDWNDLEVTTAASSINVTGGTLNHTLTGSYNASNSNNNALDITVTGGTYNVTLANAEGDSTFVLGTDDTLTLDGASSSMSISTGAAANQVNLAGTVNLQNGSSLTVTQGTTVLSSSTILDGGTGATKGTLVVHGDLSVNEPGVANSPNLTINAGAGGTQITGPDAGSSITNLGTVTKTGTGTTTIGTNVNNIEANRIVINQGTLMNGTSNQIDNSTKITLGGGTYDTNGFDEIVDTLTLTGNSTIDLDGSGSDSVLKFDKSSGETWTGGTALSITGWSGSTSGGGTDQIYFGSSSSGLTSGQLSQIQFINPLGFAPGIYGARILSTGEIVPYVPEASTALSAVLLMGVALKRRRMRRSL